VLVFAIAAAFVTHAAVPPPEVQVAACARSVPFHLLELSSSGDLLGAQVISEPDGTVGCRQTYAIEGIAVEVDERAAEAADQPPTPSVAVTIFSLDGYPAAYASSGDGYSSLDAITWYRPDVLVRVWSAGRASAPMLIDVTLGLR